MIGSKFSRPFFNQLEVKPKPIVASSCTFSRALCRLRVITSSFDWFTGLSPSFLIGQNNYFGFGFTILDWNSLYDNQNTSFVTLEYHDAPEDASDRAWATGSDDGEVNCKGWIRTRTSFRTRWLQGKRAGKMPVRLMNFRGKNTICNVG